jgi:predicted ester cyclase
MDQIGHRTLLPNSSGEDGIVPGPSTHDGVLLEETDTVSSLRSLNLVEAMLNGLWKYDQVNLTSMEQHKYWQSKKMVWYGPSGIGTTRGLQDFQDHHQRPFLQAFPNRKAGNHIALFGNGNYASITGWPSISATHEGNYLGVPATGKQITMRVMDWYRREDDRLIENWVFIDIIDLFLQLDIDLLAGLPTPLLNE